MIDYLINMKYRVNSLYGNSKFIEKDFPIYSNDAMETVKIDKEEIQKCVENSFISKGDNKIDYDLDDNTLLKEE